MPLGDDNPARVIDLFPTIGPDGKIVYARLNEAIAPIALSLCKQASQTMSETFTKELVERGPLRIIAAGILVLIASLGLTGIVLASQEIEDGLD